MAALLILFGVVIKFEVVQVQVTVRAALNVPADTSMHLS